LNLAVSTLGLFLLVLPGILFRRFFLRGPRGFPVAPRALPDEVAFSALAAALLHGLWGWLFQSTALRWIRPPVGIDLRRVALLVFGHEDEAGMQATLAGCAAHLGVVFGYFIGLYVFAALAGLLAHLVAARLRWLSDSHFFGFNSRWHQLIDGQLYFRGTNQKPKGLVYCIVSAVVDQGKESYVYQGLILDTNDLTFDSDGNLEELTLRGARRRKLSDDRRADSADQSARFYNIDGDLFVLRYADTRTINFNYVALTPVRDPSAPHAPPQPPVPQLPSS
jgi:hypothetical protein